MTADVAEIIRFAQSLDFSPESIERLYERLLGAFGIPKPSSQPRKWEGKLISIDGHSGSGKDTQIRLLQREFEVQCNGINVWNVVPVILKRLDPFRAVAKALWDSPSGGDRDCSFLLLCAGRKYVADAVVLPLLQDAATVVLQNRSYLSHVAYHAGERCVDELLALCEFDPRADLSLVLTCETSPANERISRRAAESGKQLHINETPEFIDRVKPYFRQLGKTDKLVFVDTSPDAKIVAQRILRHADACLGHG